MKTRFITLTTLTCMFFLTLNAQEMKLVIENTAGGLKEAMTPEEIKTVTDLTLTGSMNDADFYLIRDEMPKLKYLDMKYVEVDTVPQRAFYENRTIYQIILPLNIKYIADEAFSQTMIQILISGNFPKLGNKVFFSISSLIPSITEDNTSCIIKNKSIYSSDGKVLYYYFGLSNDIETPDTIPEGTEVIAERAFDCSWLQNNVIFPSTLKRIEANAFNNISLIVVTSNFHDFRPDSFFFRSENPPVLAKDAFAFSGEIFFPNYFNAWVPKGTKEIYKKADPQWSSFRYLLEEGESIPVNISSHTLNSLSVRMDGDHWILNGESIIKRIDVFDFSGKLLESQLCDNTEIRLPVNQNKGIRIVKISYKDSRVERIKLIN